MERKSVEQVMEERHEAFMRHFAAQRLEEATADELIPVQEHEHDVDFEQMGDVIAEILAEVA